MNVLHPVINYHSHAGAAKTKQKKPKQNTPLNIAEYTIKTLAPF